MARFSIGCFALLFILCAYQWTTIRAMKADIDRLRRDQDILAKSAMARQFTAEAHDEALRTLTWLDDYYRAPAGFRRPGGLCPGGTLDIAGATGSLFDTYLRLRVEGDSEGMAREKMVKQLQASGEWHAVHPGS